MAIAGDAVTAETAKSSSQGSSSPELGRDGFSAQSSIFCPSQQAGMESHVGTAEHPDAGEGSRGEGGEGRRGEGRGRKGRGKNTNKTCVRKRRASVSMYHYHSLPVV